MYQLDTVMKQFLSEAVEAGQAELAERMRILLYKANPRLFDAMVYGDDASFFDSCCSRTSPTLSPSSDLNRFYSATSLEKRGQDELRSARTGAVSCTCHA